jgi:hypothetical protein
MWDGIPIADVIAGRANPNRDLVNFNVRLLEAETAKDNGISFGNDWYSIPVQVREYMIAARLARQWIETLQADDIMRRSKW